MRVEQWTSLLADQNHRARRWFSPAKALAAVSFLKQRSPASWICGRRLQSKLDLPETRFQANHHLLTLGAIECEQSLSPRKVAGNFLLSTSGIPFLLSVSISSAMTSFLYAVCWFDGYSPITACSFFTWLYSNDLIGRSISNQESFHIGIVVSWINLDLSRLANWLRTCCQQLINEVDKKTRAGISWG